MTNKFFDTNIKTFNDLKNAYRKLARKLHPDMESGSEKLFKAMKDEYDKLFKLMKDGKFDTESERKKHSNMKYDFQEIIDKLVIIEGIDIEVIGDWIWVSGIGYKDTEKREAVKSVGCQWMKGRKKWAYKGTVSRYWKKGMTMEQMRNHFGHDKIEKGYAPNKPLLED